MAASSANADSNLNDGNERKDEFDVEGMTSYPLCGDRTSHFFNEVNLLSSRDNACIERCLSRPKLQIIVVYNDQSSLPMV